MPARLEELLNAEEEGIEFISQLVRQAGKKIIIMPGSGINESNIELIARNTGATEFHLTGRKIIESEMTFRRQNISMGNTLDIPEFSRKVVDPDMIRSIINKLKLI